MLSAWEQGYDLAELLGFERAMTAPWSDEVPVPVTVAGISELLGGQLTPEDARRRRPARVHRGRW